MTVGDLLATLERSGAVVTAEGDRLIVEAPRGAVTEELRQVLREHKPDLLEELSKRAGWPLDSLEAERWFGVPHARLYPFLGKTVATPDGLGRLVQVFPERAAVVLDCASGTVLVLLPSEVRPVGVARQPGEPFEAVN